MDYLYIKSCICKKCFYLNFKKILRNFSNSNYVFLNKIPIFKEISFSKNVNVSEYGPGINFEVFEIYLETSYSTKLHEGSQVFPYCNITKILIFFSFFK